MPTIITHAIVPFAAGLGLGKKIISRRLLAIGTLAAILPDADVIAFKFGIPYADTLGHRGFSHSILCAMIAGLFAAGLNRWLQTRMITAFLFVTGAVLSHSLLDMVTNGGLGVALYWPWSEQRLFASWRPVEVSPFIKGFFSMRGVLALRSELVWIWLPALTIMLTSLAFRRCIDMNRTDVR
jgi:inner membrane protein